MASYNKTILLGNLTRDTELKYLANGTAICSFSIAINETWMQNDEKQEKVSYFDCQAWSKLAETVDKYFTKGQPIFLEGSLRQERWETEDGQNRSKVIINVNRVMFLPRGEDKKDDIAPRATAPSDPAENVPF